ncbi:hypothetical protein KAU40_01280 [Candidatus Parcubacteria bacterium]|nr:hypothetical protein [Candidatus Parcubacteria bacterium]
MNKKIYDILPPKEVVEETVEKIEKEHFSSDKSKKGIVISLILITVFLFCYFTLPKAEIEIWPKTEILSFETNKVISGEIREKETFVSQEFSSSGKIFKEKKAEGIIRVYNNYSASPQILVVKTRFVSSEGKLFKSIERVTIPGMPGFLDIKVKADKPGPEYNIEPSTFSIPGFAGTARYTKFYGKSFKSMEGGMKEEVIQVSQEDLEQAKKTVKEKAIQDCKTALKNIISEDYFLLDSALETKIIKTSSSAEPGQQKEKFSVQTQVKSIALVFKRKDIEDFAKMFILSQISEDKKFYQESLEISYSSEVVNLESKKMSFDLKLQGKIYSDIEQTNLKKALTEKSLSEVKLFLENQTRITKADVYFWPFWVKKVPKNTEKIEIELKFD